MKKILSLTNKVTSTLNSTQAGANIPASSLTRALGFEGDVSLNSLSDIKNTISQLQLGISTWATLGYCAWVLTIGKNGNTYGGWESVLGSAIEGSAAIIADIYKQIADAVAAQIGMAVGQIIGVVTNIVSAFSNLVSSILILTEGIALMIKSWSNWGNIIWELLIEEENCKDVMAAIAACYLNKLLGPYIELFTSNIVGKINEAGSNFNEKLFDEFQDINMFSSYMNQLAFLLQKASIQIKGLTKENLLGADYAAYETKLLQTKKEG